VGGPSCFLSLLPLRNQTQDGRWSSSSRICLLCSGMCCLPGGLRTLRPRDLACGTLGWQDVLGAGGSLHSFPGLGLRVNLLFCLGGFWFVIEPLCRPGVLA
jgi:hypothetical protein